MRKIKYILATILSAFLVMLSIVVGGKVTAATKNGSYELVDLLDASYDPSTTNISQPSDHGIFKSFISSKYRFQAATTDWTGNVEELSDYTYNFQLRNSGAGFSIVIELDEGQSAQLNYVFFGATGKKITVGTTQLATSGYGTLVSGNLSLTTGTTTVVGTGSVDILKFEVVISGGVEKQYYDVKYYDSDKTTEFTILADSVEENGKVTKPQDPEKLGYLFDKWINMDDDSEFDFDNYTVTGALNLYATYTTLSNIKTLDLNTMKLAKEALGTDKSATDRALTGTIYTLLQGNTVMASSSDTVGSLGVASACIKTGGTFQAGKNGVSLTVVSSGTITIWAKSGNSTERDFGLYKDGDITIEDAPTGHVTSSIAQYTLSVSEAGTYQLGSTSGSVVLYYISFTTTSDSASVTLESQANSKGDSIRYITTLTGVELADVTSWSVSFTLTGVANAVTTAEFTTLYLAVAGTNGKAAQNGTFYLVYTITEIPTTANEKELTATMTITFADGSTKTTNIALDTIAVTE